MLVRWGSGGCRRVHGQGGRIADGDTLTVFSQGKSERIRLNGIDGPEHRQGFGTRAKRFASHLVFETIVTIRENGRDRYGRMLGDVLLKDGRFLNQELVRAGLAWWYWQYSKDPQLEALEAEARAAKRGLWADRRRSRLGRSESKATDTGTRRGPKPAGFGRPR